jgi:hypothetical protein
MKWCTGLCGRYLPRTEFHVNMLGNPQGRCKACHRVHERERYRRRYRNNSEFRRGERDRKRAEYHREAA